MIIREQRPADAAEDKILVYIKSQALLAHSRLPSEREMCELWNVNRSTLRSAIARLTREGLLYSRRGAGTFVAGEKLVCDLQSFETVSQAVLKAGRRLDTEVVGTDIIECTKQLLPKLELPLGSRIFVLTRLRRADGVPFCLETAYIGLDGRPGLERHNYARESLYAVLREQCAANLHRGEEKLSVTFATAQEAEYLELEDNEPVFFLRGRTLGGDGRVVEYFKNITRPDMVRYTSVLTRDGKESGELL